MAPGRKRGGKGVKTKSELRLGDLVLAKVKGFPAWPAKIGRPEDWQRMPDPKKYFVQFYGTAEIAFVAPGDIQAFTSESKNKLLARCQGKTVKYFAQAVKEICEEFEELQRQNLSSVRDDNSTQTLASEAHPVPPLVDEALEVNGDDGIDRKGADCKLEKREPSDLGSGLEHCLQKQDEVESQDVKRCPSDYENHNESPLVSLGKRNKLSSNYSNLVKSSPSVSTPSHYSLLKEESPLDINVKGKYPDDGLNELTNGHTAKLKMGSKNKSEGAVLKIRGSVVPHESTGEMKQRKIASGGNIKLSSADISKSSLDVGSEKKEKRLMKEKRHSESVDDGQEDAEVNPEGHNGVISRKKLKTQRSHEIQGSQTNEASYPAKRISKLADTGDDAKLVKAQTSRKSDSRSSNIFEDRIARKESKRLTLGGKVEVSRHLTVQTSADDSVHFSEEDDIPPTKRHRRASEAISSSSLISENRLGTSGSRKGDLILPNKVRSPVMQLPIKRRSVRLDDEDDESAKTPIHGGIISKVSVTARVSESKKKPVYVHDPLVLRNRGQADNGLKEPVQSGPALNKASSPAAQQGMEKKTKESSAAHVSPSKQQLDTEKLPSLEVQPVSVSPKRSPQSIDGGRSSAELRSKHSNKAPVTQKKTPAGDNKSATASNQSLNESNKQASFGDKRKTTPKSDTRINDSVLPLGTSNKNITSVRDRPNVVKDEKTSSAVDLKMSESARSMKHLIAAAQARKKQAHVQNSYGNLFPFSISDFDMPARGPSPTSATLAFESSKMLQLDVQGSHPTSPCSNAHQFPSITQHESEELEERRVSSGHQATGSSLSGGTEAAVARDAFEGMIETLSRTKESIARATRLAIDCAKYGLATEVVELLIQKLENEPSLHRRVDLFFLVDSITQCSHSQRGIAGASYVSTVQAALPRLIGAAAPAGAGAQENRRQCHKVLRLWLERKILPESVLRRYMDDMGVVNNDTSVGISSRRPSRAERSFDDPIREMEGMVVDEYGSNATFQLPGLLSANVFEEDEEYEDNLPNLCKEVDDRSLSELTTIRGRDPENHSVTPSDRRHFILEAVDGELEMEDVSGHPKDERPLSTNDTFELASLEQNSDRILGSASNVEWLPSPEGTPPLPPGSPPVTPPLPTSPPPSSPPPPPPPSPPPPPPPPLTHQNPFPQLFVGPAQPPIGPPPPHGGPPPRPIGPPPPAAQQPPVGPPPPPLGPPPHPVGPYPPAIGPPQPVGPPPPLGPPPLPSQQLYPPQPSLVSQNMANFQGNQRNHMVSNTHGSHIDTSQQSSCFPPSGVSNAREHAGYNPPRHVEYGQGDPYMNPQASQHRQQFLPGSAPFAQRPVHTELPPQRPPNHFPYPNSVQQHQYPPYSLPNFPDGQRRYATDEQWRMQGAEYNGGWTAGGRSCSGPPYPHEGYFGPPLERPPANTINFQPSAPNTQPSTSQIPAHGVPMMPCRPDMSAVNWRPT